MQDKVIVTVVGKDTVGIIAGVCTYLSKYQVNVLNITQSIVDGFFNMMMIVDIAGCPVKFTELALGLEAVGKELGVDVLCRKEEIFEMMHRV